MSYLSDAHSEWHAVNGRFVVCPLDCGVTEGLYDEDAEWSEPDELTPEEIAANEAWRAGRAARQAEDDAAAALLSPF